MPDEIKTADLVLPVLLPVLIETAVLEILEYVHSAESMTATEVLQMLAEQKARKDRAMAAYNALKAQIQGG